MIFNILYIIFILNSLIQLGYWGILFSKFYNKKSIARSKNLLLPPLSIVICAKNEVRNLSAHLIYILQQNYKTFEVVVVNDASDDDSLLILEDFKNNFSFLNIINIDKNVPRQLLGKKQALTAGIAAAKYDWILVTDADCRPRTADWAAMMMQTAVLENKEIVLGYSPYFFEHTILNSWIRFETIYTALQYISFANWGLPYMGVGRNMLYRKSLFVENGGLASHADLPSGDDDLFMRDVATAANTTVCLSAKALVGSEAKKTLADYARQKTRHLSTAIRYKPLIQVLLGALSVSHLLVYICAFIFLFLGVIKIGGFAIADYNTYYKYGINAVIKHLSFNHKDLEVWWLYLCSIFLGFALRCLVLTAHLFCVSNILHEKKLWKYSFVFDFALFLYLFVMSFSFLKRQDKW